MKAKVQVPPGGSAGTQEDVPLLCAACGRGVESVRLAVQNGAGLVKDRCHVFFTADKERSNAWAISVSVFKLRGLRTGGDVAMV